MHPIVLRRPRVFYRLGQSEVSGHTEAPALDRAPVMNGTSCWRWPILPVRTRCLPGEGRVAVRDELRSSKPALERVSVEDRDARVMHIKPPSSLQKMGTLQIAGFSVSRPLRTSN